MNIEKLKNIKGINISTLNNIRNIFGVNIKKQKKFIVSYNNLIRVKKYLRLKKTASLLQQIIRKRINNHINLRSYKGVRHKNAYPVRGQRTHTNAKTQKKLSYMRFN